MSRPPMPDLAGYDYILVACSGGKDSLACLLLVIEHLQAIGPALH